MNGLPKRVNDRDRRRLRRALRLERLEPRCVLSGDTASWDNAASLTLSFADDDTPIGSHANALAATFAAFDSQVWHEAILSAFQTWAQYSNINIGVVPDQGLPFGVSGSQTGDDRFGDIRIGAVPMSPEILAVSVPQDDRVAGTWAGDVLFNSLGTFSSVDDLFKVAFHEAGHVLGLVHSSDPLSPMYQHSAKIQSAPTATDIANLQNLYGRRGPDRNERTTSNDTLDTATSLNPNEDDDDYRGATPAVKFGALSSPTDIDIYSLHVFAPYKGPLTFEVRSSAISLLMPKLTVLDALGQPIDSVTSPLVGGDTLAIEVPDAVAGQTYYVQVEAAETGAFALGSYAVVAKFDGANLVSDDQLAHVLREANHFIGFDDDSVGDDDVRLFFSESQAHDLDDDAHTNDSTHDATELHATVSTSAIVKYQVVASLSDAHDVDVYKVKSGRFGGGSQNLIVSLESLGRDGLIGRVTVRDESGAIVPYQIRANGDGHFVVQLAKIKERKEYFVEVHNSPVAPAFGSGNYRLSASFSTVANEPTQFASLELNATTPENEFVLYIARTQLFTFAQTSTALSGDAVVWMTIYDASPRPIWAVAGPAGDTRSSASVLLDPGEYRVRVGVKGFNDTEVTPLQVQIDGRQLSQPIGPPVIDPSQTPTYSCSDPAVPYCYPGDIVSPNPFLWVVPPTLILPAVGPNVFIPPGDYWYWNVQVGYTNALLANDVNGDALVTPLDALLIIDDLNQQGARTIPPPPVPYPLSGLLDVNADQTLSPLDALLVINQLNTGATGAGGEGEAAPSTPRASPIGALAAPPDIAAWNAPTIAQGATEAVPNATSGSSGGLSRLPVIVLPVEPTTPSPPRKKTTTQASSDIELGVIPMSTFVE